METGNSVIFQPNEKYFKFYRNSVQTISDNLSYSEISIFICLTKYLCYDDCRLRINGNQKGRYMSIKELADLECMKYDTIRKIINNLIKKQAMGIHNENGEKYFTLNPFIVLRGKNADKDVVDYYSETIWATKEDDKNKEEFENSTYKFLRTKIDDWKNGSTKCCNCKCVITGGGFGCIHHVFPFKKIVDKIIANFQYDMNYEGEYFFSQDDL